MAGLSSGAGIVQIAFWGIRTGLGWAAVTRARDGEMCRGSTALMAIFIFGPGQIFCFSLINDNNVHISKWPGC